jgi:hypothetical protein
MEASGVELAAEVRAENRRSMRWVEPGFQKRYMFLLLSVVLLVSCVLVGTFWFYSERLLMTLNQAGVQKSHSLYILISQQSHSLLLSVGVVVLLFSAFIVVMANILSHRIVGPLFAIKRSLEMMERGNTAEARVQLRSEDEFHDVAAMINRVVDRLSK